MRRHFLTLLSACILLPAGISGLNSCIEADSSLGESFVPEKLRFTTYASEELPIENISLNLSDSLTGYSQSRITFGATRDDILGLSKRGCALTLVPIYDTVDFGENAVFKKFRIYLGRDTTSAVDQSQVNILQSIYVYELSHSLDSTYDINMELDVDRSKRISKSIPVFDGITDTLAFDFTKEFGEKYLKTLAAFPDSVWNDMEAYLKALPGIYIETDEPMGNGGRVNIFDLQLSFDSSYGYISSNYAQMDFSAEFDGERKDTSCLFYFSPDKFYFADSLLYYTAEGELPQYCLNVASHESRALTGKATDKLYMEGGGGLGPVIKARDLKQIMVDEISKHGDPSKALINRATLTFSYDASDDFKELDIFPVIMNPTARVMSDGVYTYASLTSTTSADISMGAIDRSNLQYRPDITYHAQSILSLSDTSSYFSNYDVRFLIMNSEVVEDSESASESDESDYYNQLMYASYYNNMYGSGYGYGSYGYSSYGYDSYSNYYNYLMYSSLYGSSSSTEETEILLDKDRYYLGILNGPTAADASKRPSLKITYSLPKDSQ